MPQRTIIGVIFVVVVAAAAAIAFFVNGPQFGKPDIREMRAFLISRMTDDQLRAAYKEAAAEAEKRQQATAAYKETARAEMNADIAACDTKMNDAAYKARHPEGCNRLPQLLFDEHPAFRTQSTDEVFDEMIIGTCAFANTVYKARTSGCLLP